MKAIFVTTCALALSVFAAGAVDAENTAPLTNGPAQFEQLKQLIGEWNAPLGKGEVMTDIFRPMGSGTAILHEEWKNGEQLTATVFYVVGNELHADHFCDYGNQLRYVAKPSSDANVVAFELRDSTNLDTHPRHFHSTTWHFIDANHHTQDWEIMSPGKDPKVVRLEFTRKA
jgi:hypothetical protein